MQHLPLNQKKFAQLIRQCKHCNLFPSDLRLYYHGYYASHPVAEILTELLHEGIEYFSILSEYEKKALIGNLCRGIQLTFLEDPQQELTQEDYKRIVFSYIVETVHKRYWSLSDIIVQERDQNSEVLTIYPELTQQFDKDGLLYLNDGLILTSNGIEYKEHILHYHQFLRRR